MLANKVKEKELEFTKNNFEPKINNNSRRMANSKLESVYNQIIRNKSAGD